MSTVLKTEDYPNEPARDGGQREVIGTMHTNIQYDYFDGV